MPIETLQPDAVTAVDDWALGAGASKVAASIRPDDEDVSYVAETMVGDIQEFECDNPSGILSADTISSVTLKYRARILGSMATVAPGLRVGSGTLAEGANQALTGSYVDYSDVFAKNPDGANWSLADLNSLRVRMRLVSVTSAQARLTTISVEILYIRASAKSQHTMLLGVG